MSIKVYIHYDITNNPWGGINSFFRSFQEYIKQHTDIEIVNSIKGDYDILLMGANAYGREERIKYSDIEEAKSRGIKVIHRLDGLRSNYTKNKDFAYEDLQQVELSKLADHIIFQSKYCYEVFKNVGLIGNNYSIINNGVNQDIFNSKGVDRPYRLYRNGEKLRVLSVSWSNNKNKGFETIANMSEMSQSFFVGNWCKGVDAKQVKIIKPLYREDLSQYYKSCDVFLHAAEGDPCPNVVLEALSSGLPIIFHNSGGTSEIVRNCGIPLTEKSLRETLWDVLESYPELVERVKESMKCFSIKFSADKYIEVFKQVLGGEV